MDDFLIVSALIGTTLIVARSTAFRPIQRLWPALLQCSQCTGVWVGAVAGASGLVSTGRGRVVDALVVAAATSFLAMLADAVLVSLLGAPEE